VNSPSPEFRSALQPHAEGAADPWRPHELQAQLALALELGDIALWRHDLRTERIQFNPRGWRMMGLDARPHGLTLAESRALLHPDDLPAVIHTAQQALVEDRPVDLEVRLRHADGSWRHIMTRRAVERDATGQAVAFSGVSLDITDRQRQDRRADEISRRFELLTSAAGIGYWQLEADGKRPFWSEPLRAMHGLQPMESVPTFGEWLRRWVHPSDRATVWHQFRDWRNGPLESLSVRMRLIRADGSVRHLMAHSRADGGPRRGLHYGLVIDLTEQHAAETALRSATERAALAARGVGLGTWELDLGTDKALWDEQMWLLRGLAPRSGAMSKAERLACLHPEERVQTVDRMDQAEAQGATLEHEFRVLWPDGQVRWIASRSVQRVDEETGLRRRVGVNWDITDLRMAEQARQEREIARRESEAKSQFLARMSHELRTPLNAVLGFAQLMHRSEPGLDAGSRERLQQLGHIRAAGQHLLALINDTLELSALQGGELRIALEPVALAPLVAQTLSMLGPVLGTNAHGARIDVQTGELDRTVRADAVRLRQVLINLLNNALKFNRPGGMVRIESSQHAATVVLRVIDTGRGMNDEQLRHLFEPFNRLGFEAGGALGHMAIEGSGIGLAIVKALVEGMGGSIRVQSTAGQGSLFEITLQAAAESTPAPPAPASTVTAPQTRAGPSAATPPGPRQVLYVEDNPVNALIMGELLARRSDVKLHVAVDGASGVERANALRPELILLDMQLPDFDGFEVLRRLRSRAETARIPCIAVSANAMPKDIEKALQAGMSGYWTKPLDLTAVMTALDQQFGRLP
jgi:PAS domain S-box-containing protein